VYTVRHADDGSATVEFGPVSRPPTGTANITATYRVGSGTAGNVAAGTITTPLSRPLGLRGVTNPVAAASGADADQTSDARRNAPLPIRALGRIVSLDDYESFARAFAGIAKARADALWSGERRIVHLTVAADDGALVDAETIADLLAAVDGARHVEAPVAITGHEQVSFELRAAVDVDPRFVAADVLSAVSAALESEFSFAERELAESVFVSDVLSVLQGVPGVRGVLLQELHPVGESGRTDIVARPARREGKAVSPAQLAVVDPAGIHLTERKR
jgi:predicted phage baseplate assembly protein